MAEDGLEREVKRRFYLVMDQYGDRLDNEQADEVREGLRPIVKAASALKAVKLDNGDEPAWVFTPFREES